MLYVQYINLLWNKDSRNSIGDKIRSDMALSYDINIKFNFNNFKSNDIFINTINFRQHNNKIMLVCSERCDFYKSVKDLSLPCIYLYKNNDEYIVKYKYDRKSGMPFRRGHNEDYNNKDSLFFGIDVINEKAFILGYGNYGRIIYNGRFVSEDSSWYYNLNIINFISADNNIYRLNMFKNTSINYIYKQIAKLY